MAFVFVINGPMGELEFKISDKPFTIGRSEKCDLVINDEKCSSLHCELSVKSQQVYLKDLNSNPLILY